MYRLSIILFLISSANFYAQKIENEIGDFKITKKGFHFIDHHKRKKISKSEFYFEAFGKILEIVSFGKPHYGKLDVKGEIEQFFYSENRLDSSKRYVFEFFKKFRYFL